MLRHHSEDVGTVHIDIGLYAYASRMDSRKRLEKLYVLR
jgi:hypothetical protein